MNENNIDDRRGIGGGEPEKNPVYARDVWHAKNKKGSRVSISCSSQASEKGWRRNKRPVFIFGCIAVGILALAALSAALGIGGIGRGAGTDISGAAHVKGDHIGVLYVEGEIGSYGDTYNHEYVLDAVEGMMLNDDNRAMMLFVNTPGGGVYESDELYLKIKEYQETTGRPVYAYFASQATSGGYYISASADKITANRNCWTGSIGVTMGTFYDASQFLEKHGIKTETIASGRNKAMGEMTSPLTAEQRQIFQSLVDEAYEQFISIVADGRDLELSYVRKIADGRLYTARQAKELKLIDDIVGTYDDAVEDLQQQFSLGDCEIYEFRYVPEYSLLDGFVKSIDRLSEAVADSGDIGAVTRLIESDGDAPIKYMCEEII